MTIVKPKIVLLFFAVFFGLELSAQSLVTLQYHVKKRDIPLSFPCKDKAYWDIPNYKYDVSQMIDTMWISGDTVNIKLLPSFCHTITRETKDTNIFFRHYTDYLYCTRTFCQDIIVPYPTKYIRIRYSLFEFPDPGHPDFEFLFIKKKERIYKLKKYINGEYLWEKENL